MFNALYAADVIVLCCAVRETAVTASHAHARVVNRWLDRTGITDIDDCFMCACVFETQVSGRLTTTS